MADQQLSLGELEEVHKASLVRLTLKTFVVIVVLNFLFMMLDPIAVIGKISLYNRVFPGRPRFPYSDDPALSFNLTVNQLDAMFASHIIKQAPKDPSEYRILLIGDSSVWGFLQKPDETLSAQLNQLDLRTKDGKNVRFYNLGYPTLSLTKDLLILDYANIFQPDLVLWFFTLEALPWKKQLDSPLLTFNPVASLAILNKHAIRIDAAQDQLKPPSLIERTIIGRRRLLADLLRHQIYGLLWTATGIDQNIPETFTERAEDLTDNTEFQGISPEQYSDSLLAFDVLRSGIEQSSAPVVLINEPIFVSDGANSDIRYNFYYPIWVYDHYLSALEREVSANGWSYINLWDILPGDVFTDSAIHYDLNGVGQVITELLSSPPLANLVN